jgi:TonB-linked SusC/RagA family outer membrane protein
MLAASSAAVLLLAAAGSSLAAQGTITGVITAAGTQQPLGQSRVLIVGGNVVTTTGDDGKYTLRNVNGGTVTVEALHVGYQSQKKVVTVTNGQVTTADFTMVVAVVQLQEVVTTATGQQRRVELGNTVSTLGDVGKKVEESQISTLSDLLLAKAPGVIVLPGTTVGGAPNVRIRGVSSISLANGPIYVVDGVRYNSGTTPNSGTDTQFSFLNSLNPEDIQDIQIVKGPSAATLYGTSAANGVVEITTKRGRAGATRWNWFGEAGSVQDRTKYQPMYANWGHSPGSTTQVRCQLPLMLTPAAQGGTPCITDSLTKYLLLRDPSATFVHDGQRSQYGVSASGGSDALRFFVSSDIDDEVGPLQMPGYEIARFDSLKIPVRGEWLHPLAQQKLNFRTNLNAALSPKFDLGVNMGFSKNNNRINASDDLIIALLYVQMQNYGFKGPGLDKIVNQVDGTPLHDALQWAPGDIMQYYNTQDLQRMTGSINASWRPFSWMQNDGTLGMDLTDLDFFHLCRLNECPPQSTTARVGNVTDNRSNFRNYSVKMSSTGTWNARSWMNLKTSIGADYTNIETDAVNSTGQTLPPGASTVAAASTRNASQTQPTAVKTLGFYAQEQAALRDRLFLTVAVRSDQNSAFGTNFQKVYYPKASVSWIASDEPMFPKWSWLNQFRLRGAYGASGVQPGSTAALVTFSAASVSVPVRGVTNGTDTPSLTAAQPGLPNLKPETSKEFEGGFDSQILNNRVHIDYTYYQRTSHDALISVPLAPSSAAPQLSILQNIGSIRNSGHEVQINTYLVDRKNFGWDITINGSHNTNLVLDLGIDPGTGKSRIVGAGGTTEQVVGLPINGQWYRPYTFEDKNKNGILEWNSTDALSEVHVDSVLRFKGTNSPRDLFSIQNGFDLFQRKVRLNLSFDYKGGGNSQDGANNFQCNTAPRSCAETQDPKSPLNEQARSIAKTYGSTYPNGLTFKSSGGYFISNQFWKFREASVVWQLPGMLVSRVRAQNGSNLVLSLRNIHTWTGYTDLDPEVNYGLSQAENQNNFQTSAAPTYIVLRLNLKY